MDEIKDMHFDSLKEPLTDLHIAYNYAFHLKEIHKSYITLDKIIGKLFKNTFLPSLEEMDEIVLETKKTIQKIVRPKNLLDTIELFSEKKQLTELKKLFSNL